MHSTRNAHFRDFRFFLNFSQFSRTSAKVFAILKLLMPFLCEDAHNLRTACIYPLDFGKTEAMPVKAKFS